MTLSSAGPDREARTLPEGRKPRSRFLELDALRGIAAVSVVVFHLTIEQKAATFGYRIGVTGVDLFFIISGFVIFLTLENTRSWRSFLVNRFSRLFPTYWACVTFTAILILWRTQESSWHLLPRYLANMTMFQSYLLVKDLDGPYWTMLVEMLFYIYMLAIYLAKSLHRIEWIGALTLVPVFIYGTPYFKDHFGSLHSFLQAALPLINHFPLFLSGILFYKLKVSGRPAHRYLLLAACFGCQLLLFDDGGRSNHFISFRENLWMDVAYYGLFLIYAHANLKILVNRATLFFGSISFSLYLVHQYVCVEILLPGLLREDRLDFPQAFAVSAAFVVVMATLITKFIEQPAMRFIRKRVASPQPKLAMATPSAVDAVSPSV